MFPTWYDTSFGSYEEQIRAALAAVTGPESHEYSFEFFQNFFRSQEPPHPIFNHARYDGFDDYSFERLAPAFALASDFLTSEHSLQFINAFMTGERTHHTGHNGNMIKRLWRPVIRDGRLSPASKARAETILRELAEFVYFIFTDQPAEENGTGPDAWTSWYEEWHRTEHLHGRRSVIRIGEADNVYIPEMRFENDEYSELGYAWTTFVFGGHVGLAQSGNYLVLRQLPHADLLSPSSKTCQCGEGYPYIATYSKDEKIWKVPKSYVYDIFEMLQGKRTLGWSSLRVPRVEIEQTGSDSAAVS
ncbi:hypothetical protein Slin14017_G101710 [Septoria linicola]|nr:hypothetical protein Slin14017_G101710 [Septoria linicola]